MTDSNANIRLLGNNQGPTSISEILRRNTHRILGGFMCIGYAFATASTLSANAKPLGTDLYVGGCAVGFFASLLVTVASERSIPQGSWKTTLKGLVTPPFHILFDCGDPRRFLAFTNVAVHGFIYLGHGFMEKNFALFGSMLFGLSTLCNTALCVPKTNETGYILYGLATTPVQIALLALNSSDPASPQSILLATTNAVSLAMSLLVLGVNAYSRKEAIKKADGCGKVGALFTGESGLVMV